MLWGILQIFGYKCCGIGDEQTGGFFGGNGIRHSNLASNNYCEPVRLKTTKSPEMSSFREILISLFPIYRLAFLPHVAGFLFPVVRQ